MLGYIRFGSFLLLSAPLTGVGVLRGGAWTWLGLVASLGVLAVGDKVLRPDRSTPELSRPWLLDLLLYAQLPVCLLAIALLSWRIAPGDLWGIGSATQPWSRGNGHPGTPTSDLFSVLGAILSVRVVLTANFYIAHELVHRQHNRFAVAAGRWLLAAVADTQFAIAHLYGHHRHVGTPMDPATARRGETLYRFVGRSAVGQLASAWYFEAERLDRRGEAVWGWRNRFLRGQAMTALIVAVVAVGAGWQALLGYLLCVACAKFVYESVNYIQHYGLVRVPGARIEPRHSWDSAAPLSSAYLLNLTRHADHHARASVPYWRLRLHADAPALPGGYFSMVLVAMVPPLWRRTLEPLLRDWDRHHASADELAALRTSAQ